MKIYVSHSKDFDFQNELYKPLKESHLPIEFIFPHELSKNTFNSQELFQKRGCDYVLAEISRPSTGQGIELAWAHSFQVPIICVYRQGSVPAKSLETVASKVIEYSDFNNLINNLTVELGLHIA